MYLSLADLKTRMGVTDNSRDVELQQLLNDSSALLSAMWYDYTSKSHTKIVSHWDFCGLYLYLDHPEVTSLDTIDGTAYAGAVDTDYYIASPLNARLIFENTPTLPSKRRFKITYTAWYTPPPSDMALGQYFLIQVLILGGLNNWATASTGAIKKIKLWPKEIEYAVDSESDIEKYNLDFQSIFKKYSLPILTSF